MNFARLLPASAPALLLALGGCRVSFPGTNIAEPLASATPEQTSLAQELRSHVEHLAGTIGPRSLAEPEKLFEAERYLASTLEQYGYEVRRQTYDCQARDASGVRRTYQVSNLEVEIPGISRPDEYVVIGAHYDSVHHRKAITPGADDNASGTAGVLALAKMMAGSKPARTVRFVLFVNEEPPYFWSEQMGSRVYASAAKHRGDKIVAMLCFDMIGYYSEKQEYPPLVELAYPKTGNFVAFVGMSNAEPLVTQCVTTFREKAAFPCEGAALPWIVPRVGSSDHWSFWVEGYAAAMVTDTAKYRNKNYHKISDTPDTLNYDKMARVVSGMQPVIESLCTTERALRAPDPQEF